MVYQAAPAFLTRPAPPLPRDPGVQAARVVLMKLQAAQKKRGEKERKRLLEEQEAKKREAEVRGRGARSERREERSD